MKRYNCKECPWHNNTKHNKQMKENIERFISLGVRKDKKHKCHMIDTNIWTETDSSNICIGSINN